ncbi:MAG: DUF542 domain-containing protein [Ignavibacteria bacterium]|nr:DUF542 domain-containing protein [Ignavibacteria bacterium]
MHNSNNDSDLLRDFTLSQILIRNFKASVVFEKYNLDFCCSGNKSLLTACSENAIDYKEVLSELNNLTIVHGYTNHKHFNLGIISLIDFIISYHHGFVRNIIPVIATHTQIIASIHGKINPKILEVARIFSILYKDLKQHMMKEEEIIFPYIKQLVMASNNLSKAERPYFGNLGNPIKMLEEEHFISGDELLQLRELTDNYEANDNACYTQKLCYQELKEFEEDLNVHVFLENNILFPKAIQLEKEILGV